MNKMGPTTNSIKYFAAIFSPGALALVRSQQIENRGVRGVVVRKLYINIHTYDKG